MNEEITQREKLLQKIAKIEAEFKKLRQRCDRGELKELSDFKEEVDKLEQVDIKGKKWRINLGGGWICWNGTEWKAGNIYQEVDSLNGPLPGKGSYIKWIIVSAIVILLLMSGGLAVWSLAGGRNQETPAAAVASPLLPTATLTPLPAAGTVNAPPTSEPTSPSPQESFTPVSLTEEPSPLPPATELPSATAAPMSSPTTKPASSSPPAEATPSPTAEPPPSPTTVLSPSPITEPQPATSEPILPPPPPTPALQGKIAYADYDMANETYHIYLLDVTTLTVTKFIEAAAEPSFSPDGLQIAYRSWHPEKRGLWVQNGDGSGQWQLSKGHESARPQWSPNGDRLIFPSRQSGDRSWGLYYSQDVPVSLSGPAWAADWLSPDQLIYAGIVGDKPGLYLANINGSAPQPLTSNRSDTAPAISPDGRSVAYTSQGETGNNWDVYIVTNDGGSPRRLTTAPSRDGLPAWSPDGAYVAFASDQGGSWGIWVIDAAGQSEPRRLATLTYGLDLYPREATEIEKQDWTFHTLAWSP